MMKKLTFNLLSLLLVFAMTATVNAQVDPFECLNDVPDTVQSEEDFMAWAEENCPDAFEMLFGGGAPWPTDPTDPIEPPIDPNDPFICLEDMPADLDTEEDFMSWIGENCPESFELLFGGGDPWPTDPTDPIDPPVDPNDPFLCLNDAPLDFETDEDFLNWAEVNCPEAYALWFGGGDPFPEDSLIVCPGPDDAVFACLETAPQDLETEEDYMAWVEVNCPEAFELLFGGGVFPGDPTDPWPTDPNDPFLCLENAPVDLETEEDFMVWAETNCPDAYEMLFGGGDLTDPTGIIFIDIPEELEGCIDVVVDDLGNVQIIWIDSDDCILPSGITDDISATYGEVDMLDIQAITDDILGILFIIDIQVIGKTGDVFRLTYDANGQLISEELITSSGLTAIEDVLIKARPNPATDEFSIDLPNDNTSLLSVYSLNGELVQQLEASGTTTVYTTDMANGLYLIRIDTNEGSYSGRIAVQR